MEKNLQTNPAFKDLCSTMSQINSPIDMAAFLRDLCTLKELADMTERWQIVRLLQQGLSYRAIANITKSSTTTITRVAYWLRSGEGGYASQIDPHHQNKNPVA